MVRCGEGVFEGAMMEGSWASMHMLLCSVQTYGGFMHERQDSGSEYLLTRLERHLATCVLWSSFD